MKMTREIKELKINDGKFTFDGTTIDAKIISLTTIKLAEPSLSKIEEMIMNSSSGDKDAYESIKQNTLSILLKNKPPKANAYVFGYYELAGNWMYSQVPILYLEIKK